MDQLNKTTVSRQISDPNTVTAGWVSTQNDHPVAALTPFLVRICMCLKLAFCIISYINNVLPSKNISGTVLHVAARDNSIQCAEAILSHSKHACVDALATEHQQTPLMTAAAHGHVDIVRFLVAAGADINRQTNGCSTALIIACHYGHVDCVNALLGK